MRCCLQDIVLLACFGLLGRGGKGILQVGVNSVWWGGPANLRRGSDSSKACKPSLLIWTGNTYPMRMEDLSALGGIGDLGKEQTERISTCRSARVRSSFGLPG